MSEVIRGCLKALVHYLLQLVFNFSNVLLCNPDRAVACGIESHGEWGVGGEGRRRGEIVPP